MTLLTLKGSAQIPFSANTASNLKTKTFRIDSDSLKIDTVSIVPATFIIYNISSADYQLDFVKAILYWIKKPAQDSITVSYRTFPFQLNAAKQRLSMIV